MTSCHMMTVHEKQCILAANTILVGYRIVPSIPNVVTHALTNNINVIIALLFIILLSLMHMHVYIVSTHNGL